MDSRGSSTSNQSKGSEASGAPLKGSGLFAGLSVSRSAANTPAPTATADVQLDVQQPIDEDIPGPLPADMQLFKVLNAVTGEEQIAVKLSKKPPPKVAALKAKITPKGVTGQLLYNNDVLQDQEKLPLDESGITELQIIKSNLFIQVKEAGYYNGVYEEIDKHQNRPVFQLRIPDHPRSGKDRFIMYTTGNHTPEGWKCVRNYRDLGSWDMLRDSRPDPHDDFPYGKWTLNNGGTDPKPNAPNIIQYAGDTRSKAEKLKDVKKAEAEQDGNDSHDVCAGCFNGTARIRMADGSFKLAQDIAVGDMVLSGEGLSTRIEACIIEEQCHQRLVQIRDFLITFHHPVVDAGRWVQPSAVEGSRLVEANIPLYNFVTTNRDSIIIEDVVATSVGTYCEGLHDMTNPEHQVWGTDTIVDIYKQHPCWPNIVSNSQETIMAVAAAMSNEPPPIWRYAWGKSASTCQVGFIGNLRDEACQGEHRETPMSMVACC